MIRRSLPVQWLVSIWLLGAGAAGVRGEESSPTATDDLSATELYNGIQLPSSWPPNVRHLNRAPMPVPYLSSLPKVVPIDVGRQLFVDDFLIERTTLQRQFHQARLHPASPVLAPDKSWELDEKHARKPSDSHAVQRWCLV